jgi:hypothetical protein
LKRLDPAKESEAFNLDFVPSDLEFVPYGLDFLPKDLDFLHRAGPPRVEARVKARGQAIQEHAARCGRSVASSP